MYYEGGSDSSGYDFPELDLILILLIFFFL